MASIDICDHAHLVQYMPAIVFLCVHAVILTMVYFVFLLQL